MLVRRRDLWTSQTVSCCEVVFIPASQLLAENPAWRCTISRLGWKHDDKPQQCIIARFAIDTWLRSLFSHWIITWTNFIHTEKFTKRIDVRCWAIVFYPLVSWKAVGEPTPMVQNIKSWVTNLGATQTVSGAWLFCDSSLSLLYG